MKIDFLNNKVSSNYYIPFITVIVVSLVVLPFLDRKASKKNVEVLSSEKNTSYNRLTIYTLKITRGLLWF